MDAVYNIAMSTVGTWFYTGSPVLMGIFFYLETQRHSCMANVQRRIRIEFTP